MIRRRKRVFEEKRFAQTIVQKLKKMIARAALDLAPLRQRTSSMPPTPVQEV
jgi:hypothetical protein